MATIAGAKYRALARHLLHLFRLLPRDQFISVPKHCHVIAGEFGIVSNEMKLSPICLGDYEAIERSRWKGGSSDSARMSSSVTGSSTSPFCCCWSRSTSASGSRRASSPSCIFICSSQTLARLKCKLFVDDWHASRTTPDSFDCSPSHQINAWVSNRSFTRRDQAKSRPEAAHRNRPPIPMLPHADPRSAAKLDVAAQYTAWFARVWRPGTQGAVPFAHPVTHLQQLRFRSVCPHRQCSIAITCGQHGSNRARDGVWNSPRYTIAQIGLPHANVARTRVIAL
jgi:hypothetical protein